MPNITEQLEALQSELKLWRGRALDIKGKYDVLESNKLRRKPRIETSSEGGIYDMRKRLQGANIGRDLERNYSPAKGIIHQFRMNVVGSLGKIQVNGEGGEEATAWFNEEWAKDCDMRDDMHWSTACQNAVASVLREGDFACVFDDGLIEDSGKLMFWEADQVVPVSSDVFTQMAINYQLPEGSVQDSGIIRDKIGRTLGYIVTGKRGVEQVGKIEDVTFYRKDVAWLPKNPWRLNQGRGVPTIISAAQSFLDVYEMLVKELQTAKKAASQYAMVSRTDAVEDWDDPSSGAVNLPENDGKSATTVAADGANDSTSPEARNYESLEAFTGGYTDYGDVNDKIQFPPADRPNVHMAEFIEAVHCHAGAAFGMAKAYALLRADSSYTAFRGDMMMTWAGAFYPTQKWLERTFADRVGRKAIAWAIRKRMIAPIAPGWERRISWKWPRMPEVNLVDAANATALELKNGSTNFSDILGPDWKMRLGQLAEQVDEIKRLGLPLSILEMKSGGSSEAKQGEEDAKPEDEEESEATNE
jgi:capsid protein